MARTVTQQEWASAVALVSGTVLVVDTPGILPLLRNSLLTLTTHVGAPNGRRRNQRRIVTSELSMVSDEEGLTFRGGVLELHNGTRQFSGRLNHTGRVVIGGVPPGQYTRKLHPPSET